MYTFHSKVRYSETAENGYLSLSSAVNYFQDCSTFQSEALGVGVAALQQAHHAWFLNSWQIVLDRLPTFGDEIAVSTWASGFKGCYGYRNFLMQDSDGHALVYAHSIWVYVDTLTGRPSRCTEEAVSAYPIEPAYPMEHAPRKITIPETRKPLPTFPVRPSYIDTNHHVNNCGYIQMASDLLPTDFTYHQVRAEYRTSAVLGDTIIPSIAQNDDSCTIVLASEQGGIYCIVEFM